MLPKYDNTFLPIMQEEFSKKLRQLIFGCRKSQCVELRFFALKHCPYGTRNKHRRISTCHNTYYKGQSKFLNGLNTYNVENNKCKECGNRCVYGAGKSLPYTLIYCLCKGNLLCKFVIFSYSVKHNDCIID